MSKHKTALVYLCAAQINGNGIVHLFPQLPSHSFLVGGVRRGFFPPLEVMRMGIVWGQARGCSTHTQLCLDRGEPKKWDKPLWEGLTLQC